MKKWIKSGLKSLFFSVPINIVAALGVSFVQSAFGAPFFSFFLKSLFVYIIFISIPIFLIVTLLSYIKNRK